MIVLRELISDDDYLAAPIDHKFNLQTLHYRLNLVRQMYAEPMIVTSGYRTRQMHQGIYERVNERRIKEGLSPVQVPWKSMHLRGAAADIYDEFGRLKKWINENMIWIEEAGLWIEDFEYTKNWVHFQIFPPRSGLRFFKPY